MGRRLLGRHIAAIDVGTTKICVLVAQLDVRGALEVIGMGYSPSEGLKKGVVVNINKTVESIRRAVEQAEAMVGVPIESATVGISGGHIRSFNSRGIVAIKNKEVTQEDIDRVIEAAEATPIPEGREILHILPQYFKVDGQEYVQDSLGMHGVRLEAQIHIITGAIASAQDIVKSCEKAGVLVSDIVLEQVASAEAVLSDTERDLGVGIIDIGGGTSDFAVYKDGRIRHSKVLPIAGSHFTNDLAIGLGVTKEEAEQLKRTVGFVAEDLYLELERASVDIELSSDGKKKTVDAYSLFEILEPRAQEIFTLFNDEINEFKLRTFMPAGIVLTGGGALLSGMSLLAKEAFDMNVRIGFPRGYSTTSEQIPISDALKSPIYSTAYGLLVYALRARDRAMLTGGADSLVKRIFKSMKSWVYDFL